MSDFISLPQPEQLPKVKRSLGDLYPVKHFFLSDIEGSWKIINDLLKNPEIFNPDRSLVENVHLTFLGDIMDKQSGDPVLSFLAPLEFLVDLFEKHPGRVTLISGNRDANKMRLIPEMIYALKLAYDALGIQIPKIEIPENILAELLANKIPDEIFQVIIPSGNFPIFPWIQDEKQLKRTFPTGLNVIDFLRYIFDNTMGMPSECAFQEFKKHLESIGREQTDVQVIRLALEIVSPGGIMYRFLEYAKIAEVCEKSLCVHGGLIATVPGIAAPFDDIHEWLHAINSFYSYGFVAYANLIRDQIAMLKLFEDNKYPVEREGSSFVSKIDSYHLVAYTLPQDASAVSPTQPGYFEPVQELLPLIHNTIQKGIKNVFMGHKPIGDVPEVFHLHGLTWIRTDCHTYGTGTLWWNGTSWMPIIGSDITSIIEVDLHGNIRLSGVLSDGSTYLFDSSHPNFQILGTTLDVDLKDLDVDFQDPKEWTVKALLEGPGYLISMTKGFTVYNYITNPRGYHQS